MNPARRRCLLTLMPLVGGAAGTAAADSVRRGRRIELPRDHGAHLDARTEWWYATGWLGRPEAPSHGFQVTFFRSRTGHAADLAGRLAPRHVLFAHAAVTELASQRHLHDQRLVRWDGSTDGAPRQAAASSNDTQVWIGGWLLQRRDGVYSSRISASNGTPWALDLVLQPTQPVLLQGDAGFSRKGPEEQQASHYYSLPQLGLSGRLSLGQHQTAAEGRAWLDHEWSDEYLAPGAVGWDWIGFNLFDGSALTAFRLRRADGSALWAGGSYRPAAGVVTPFGPETVQWTPGRTWRSPGTGASYPMQWLINTPAGSFGVRSLLDAQELDGRRATGTVYWEGLSELLDSGGRRVGLGYLEMTGYSGVLRL